MGKKGPLWWRESDWLLRGSSAANQILLRHSGPILSPPTTLESFGVFVLPTLILHFGSLLLSVNMVQADLPAIFLRHFFEMRKCVK